MTLIHKIVNAETGEVIERAYTDEEIKEHQLSLELKQKEETAAAEKAAARQVILDRLGLTAEEAQLLLGGN